MLDIGDEGMGIGWTFGNPTGNFIFVCVCLDLLVSRVYAIELNFVIFKYIPCKMLDFRDAGMSIRRIFGNPSGNFDFVLLFSRSSG